MVRGRTIETTNFPITMIVVPGLEWLLITYYNSTRFSKDTIIRIHDDFVTVLNQILNNPEGQLNDLLSFMENRSGYIELSPDLQTGFGDDQFSI
jgi:hypothetical protein